MIGSSPSGAVRRLMQEFRDMTLNPPEGVSAGPVTEDNLFEWEAFVVGPEGTPFEGGFFKAILKFPSDYAFSPPTMRFVQPAPFHPNVYPSGEVCISILHPAGDDPLQYESASERWSPAQSIEKILLSVLSMIAEPNLESPANIEAAKMFRDERSRWEAINRQIARKSVVEGDLME